MILNSQPSSSWALAIFPLSKEKLLDCTELFDLHVCFESTLQSIVQIWIDFSKQKQNFSFIFANITLLLADLMDDISKHQAIFHKGERCQKYSMEFKKATIKYAQKITSIVQQRNSKLIEKESVSGSKRKRK